MRTAARIGTGVVAAALAFGASPALAGSGPGPHGKHGPTVRTLASLDGPRGVDTMGKGRTLVTETGGDFSLVVERRHRRPKVIPLGNLATDFPPAIAAGRHGSVFLLTGATAPPEARTAPRLLAKQSASAAARPAPGATLFRWRPGWAKPHPVADIGAYQVHHPDPYDLEGMPTESNPFGLAALRDGTVLVADAAGNDLLRVWPGGRIRTVAKLKPRVVKVPAGLPDVPPEAGGPLPPAGTPIPSEAVATSVTVGPDGAWYVGELRGFPATPGTSQIWRVKRGATNATCDPKHPRRGACTRYADGFTSITDLAAGRRGVFALELSKKSWFGLEMGMPGAEVGALYRVTRRGHHTHRREILRNRIMTPGGVDVSRDGVYLTGPLFGPGALKKVR